MPNDNTYYENGPAQTFCDCGKPLKLFFSRYQLEIRWIKNGCEKHRTKPTKNAPVSEK